MTAINIIFDGPPDHEGPRFVEIEDADGQSIRIGDWAPDERPEHEGLWRLRITLAEMQKLAGVHEGDSGLPYWPEGGLKITDNSEITVETPKEH